MTEPQPSKPEPTDDPGHVLPQEVWDAVVRSRTGYLIGLGLLDEDGSPVAEDDTEAPDAD